MAVRAVPYFKSKEPTLAICGFFHGTSGNETLFSVGFPQSNIESQCLTKAE
jgi:hypothetical protein